MNKFLIAAYITTFIPILLLALHTLYQYRKTSSHSIDQDKDSNASEEKK